MWYHGLDSTHDYWKYVQHPKLRIENQTRGKVGHFYGDFNGETAFHGDNDETEDGCWQHHGTCLHGKRMEGRLILIEIFDVGVSIINGCTPNCLLFFMEHPIENGWELGGPPPPIFSDTAMFSETWTVGENRHTKRPFSGIRPCRCWVDRFFSERPNDSLSLGGSLNSNFSSSDMGVS